MATNVPTRILSANGQLIYTDGNPDALCAVCEEEETDICWGDVGPQRKILNGQPICIYCANDRAEEWRPLHYLGKS